MYESLGFVDWDAQPNRIQGMYLGAVDGVIEVVEALRATSARASSESTPEPGSETRPGETEKRCSATPTFGSQGAAMIAAERARQVEVEGYDDEHDSEHVALYENALPLAAVAYILAIRNLDEGRAWWPWDGGSWKPKDAMRNLVRAGALLAAEIDRRLRTDAPSPAPSSQVQPAQDAPSSSASSEDGEPAQDEREAQEAYHKFLYSRGWDREDMRAFTGGQLRDAFLAGRRGVRRVSLPDEVRESDEGI